MSKYVGVESGFINRDGTQVQGIGGLNIIEIDGIMYEIHIDGVKEVCPFCPVKKPCNEPHCPYTEEE